MYQIFHEVLIWTVSYAILLFEYTGVIVIITACLRGIWECIVRRASVRLDLAKGMALGLEFKLGSEILRTVAVREIKEIFIVAAIIALRALLTFLIHWEIRNEENSELHS